MKYEVIRPWHGVRSGDVVELKQLHPALASNVRPMRAQAAELVPATAEAEAPRRGRQPKPEAEAATE